jgi:hypothetical protein
VDRCYALDDELTRLARRYSDTKFIHVRASALGFASKPASSTSRSKKSSAFRRAPRTIREDDEDPYEDEKKGFVGGHEIDEDEDDYDDEDGDSVDTDMLPTMLVYRDGDLVFNWVRVDFEAGQAGIEDLLARYVSGYHSLKRR